jgi:hypothetical protein
VFVPEGPVILPCGCDPEEGPSPFTRCPDVGLPLYNAAKAAGGTGTAKGNNLFAALYRHFDEQREQAKAQRVRTVTRRLL